MTDNDLARGRRYREAIDLSACQSMGDCAPVHAISDALATASMAVADAELAELRAQVSTLTAEVERLQNVATLNATLASRMTQRAEHAEGEASTLTAERDEARVEVERQAVLLRAIKDCHDDPARAILQADILAGEAILRREAAEAEVRDLRAEVEHWKHHAWESVERILGERIGELERENADLRAEVERMKEAWQDEYRRRESAEGEVENLRELLEAAGSDYQTERAKVTAVEGVVDSLELLGRNIMQDPSASVLLAAASDLRAALASVGRTDGAGDRS